MPSSIDVDRNLLFAVIALQDDLIDQMQFADVCAGWAVRLERPLAELLFERGWITKQDKADIERKLERKLKKHRGDVRATLGAVAEIEARDVLQVIENPRVHQSIIGLPPARGHVLVETLVPPATQRDVLRYTLTRLHAEGGLGKIWVAHDTDLNRDVALKEIKATTTLSPESWRRFLKEAQITGQLEHPNIVPVYELARRKEDDQPFYTMRFVRGQTLRDAIAEFHRRRGGRPAERLELQRYLLEPFIKVCQAVGYAHSRGVIHRDLKPENVVLGGHGEVVVLDWGLAKVVGQPEEAAPQTPETPEPRISVSGDAQAMKTHGQVGTPAYMALEQVDADHGLVDTRTDVYGLGAILFEILTGRPPVLGETIGEVFSKIRAGNLPRARELDSTIPRAIEAICHKALAHKRENRYRRAEDLAEDVRRWLVDEPVSVYHDPIPVRLMRWGRRHRTLVSALTALLLTSVIGLSIGVALVNRERLRTDQQRKLAQEQTKIADAYAATALQNLRLAQNASDSLLGEVADVDLADIPQMEPVRKRLLDKARAGYEQFLAQRGDDLRVRAGSERTLVRLGEIQALLGDVPRAEASFRQAIEILDELRKQDPANAMLTRDMARALQGLGILLKDANRFQQADPSLRRAIRLREEIAQEPNSSAEDRQSLADSRYQLGALLARRGAGRDEERAYSAALEAQHGLVQQFGDRPEYRNRLARYRNNLAIIQYAAGHPQEAERTLRETLDLLAPSIEGADALPGPRWQFARASNNLGAVLLDQEPNQAATLQNRARDILLKLTREFPAIAQYNQELASVEYNLGLSAQKSRQAERAAGFFKESAERLEPLTRQFPGSPVYRQSLARAHLAVGQALSRSKPVEAEQALGKAIEEQSAVLAEFPEVPEYQSTLGRGHYQLARLLLEPGQATYKPTEALRQLELSRQLLNKVLESRPGSETDRRNLTETNGLSTLALIAVGRIAEAVATAQRIPTIAPADARAYLHAAVLLVRCADATPRTLEGTRHAEEIKGGAVTLLRAAAKAGLITSKVSLDIEELASLRDRVDFQRLRDSLGEAPRPG